jgi:5-methylcytosine-specific restriction endonuclease McrA
MAQKRYTSRPEVAAARSEASKVRYQANRVEANARSRAYYAAHKEQAKLRQRQKYAEMSQEERSRSIDALYQWRDENAAQYKERKRARRISVKYGISAEALDPEDLDSLWRFQEGRCVHCGSPMSRASAHLDHLTPISKGGGTDISNVAWSHGKCNVSKGDRTLAEYRASRGGMLPLEIRL